LLGPDGTAAKDGTGLQWFLNFDETEGVYLPGGVTDKVLVYDGVFNDGDDAIFGDLGNDWLVGGTGRDDIYGGWGNDVMNADDVLTTGVPIEGRTNPRKIQPSPNDTPDTHPSYEDRVYGGAGLDVLIGNTGGDRLIDWVGEFNSYIVPFAPFGIATVSRQIPPQLPEFLYALSAADGADPTRDSDTGRLEVRNGEPEGELGLITQRDHGLWQEQTGGPTDPQPGNIPGGRRDVLRSADFNDGEMSSFAVDSGDWEVSRGALAVSAASLGQDAAAVFYVDDYLPVYYEVTASVKAEKPTAGWKANGYIIFDYFSPTDFKFAGINISTNKIELGYRDANGWNVCVQSNIPLKLKAGTYYTALVAVNGTYVTVLLDSKSYFSYNFEPRILDDMPVGLNKGLVGMGSNNSRGVFDNVAVQILPPELTFEYTEDFEDGSADLFTDRTSGTWQAAGGRFDGTPDLPDGTAYTLFDYGLDSGGLQTYSYVEVEALLRTGTLAGLIFDGYSGTDYKFAAIDVLGSRVLLGHLDPRRGWVIDTAIPRTLVAGRDYLLRLTLKGASMSLMLDGSFLASWGYNAAVVDGSVGLFATGGTGSFTAFAVRTNDPQFIDTSVAMTLAPEASSTGRSPTALDETMLDVAVSAAQEYWAGLVDDSADRAVLESLRFAVADLAPGFLGLTAGTTVYVDVNAAGAGWSCLGGSVDLYAVLVHEIGHALGYTHDDADSLPVMEADYSWSSADSITCAYTGIPGTLRVGDGYEAARRTVAEATSTHAHGDRAGLCAGRRVLWRRFISGRLIQ
ncbi:MAG: hypothetical protein RQ731_08945, partial [Anaerosomatales bacterium]|nr:hypothetical protein [Anaerosomatales bacterium]